MRQIILDTETTGLDPSKGHRLTEIGCLEMINRRLTGRKFHSYINPEREIDAGAVAISGITTEFLQDKPKFHQVVDDFVDFLQEEKTELIIHNAPFDLGFLNHELGLLNHPWRPLEHYLEIMDTLVLARQLHPGQRNNLDALCKRYNVDNSHREYHGALLDAELLSKVYLMMTAGQTTMSLSVESNISSQTRHKKVKVPKIIRNNAIALRVIYATEEENRMHEARMAKLRKEKV
jgi:DNA polymerase-3 subunit epsilon